MKLRLTNSQMEEIANITSDYPYKADTEWDSVPWHWHEELEFAYVLNGEVEVSTTNKVYRFQEGEGYFMNTNVLASMKYSQNGALNYFLFHPIFLAGHFRSVFETKYLNPVLQNKKIELVELRGNTMEQQKILSKLRQGASLRNEKDSEFQTRNIFSEIWLLLMKEIANMPEIQGNISSISKERLLTMMTFIQQNYSEKISLEMIADSAMISTREALRCFQTNIHETPFEYLMGYRIEMAKKLLKASKISMTEIALQTGFSNSAYFSKIFKRECGMTPLEYRKQVL